MMTLNKTWTECLAMWHWIVEEWKEDKKHSATLLKTRWLQKNDPTAILYNGCYFCDYCGCECKKCPGRLVAPKFYCQNISYHFLHCPDKFLKKLEKLNRKRLSKKVKI